MSDDIKRELRNREPIFHQKDLCSTRELLEKYAAPDFWEVGASGKIYSRELVIDIVEKRFKENTEEDTSKWIINDFKCYQLSDHIYMVTYELNQASRITRIIFNQDEFLLQ